MDHFIKIGEFTINIDRASADVRKTYVEAYLAVETATAAQKSGAVAKLEAAKKALLAEQASTILFKAAMTPVRNASHIADALTKRAR